LVKNGSKTAVMDVIGFLCVSLGSSTVQLHDRLSSRRACACSEACFSSEEEGAIVRFLWAKGLNTEDIHKDMFPLYGEKCLSRKVVHNWVANVSLMKSLERSCGRG
jgi:hypothetical protein